MTYETLQDRVESWLDRSDMTDVIPSLIELAEASLNRRLRTRQMLTRAEPTLDQELVELPDDYEEWRSFAYEGADGFVPLNYITPDRANLLHYDETGAPMHFTVEGSELRLLPAPDDVYTGRLLYYASIPPLSDTVTTNWLLTAAPDVYLYATLLEAAPYLRDDERVATWAALLERRISDLTAASVRSEVGGGPLAPRQRKGFD